MDFFYDTYAIMCLINGDENYENYKEYVINTSLFNLAELYNIFLRDKGKQTAEYWINKLNFNIIDIDKVSILKAVEFRFDNKEKGLSLADCIGYILACRENIKFLTGDKEFENLKNVEFVKESEKP